MRMVIISDCHLGHPGCNTEALFSFLKTLECDRLILAGDFWELWGYSLRDIKKRYPEFIQLLQILSRNIIVEMVAGNHDLKYGDDPLITGLKIVDELEINHYGSKILIIHGHQFDGLWWRISQRVLYTMNLWFRKIVRFGYSDAFGGNRCIAKRLREDVYKRYKNYFYVVVGHSHVPEHQRPNGGIGFVNCGNWLSDNSYVLIDEDGVSLKYYESS